MKRRRRVKHNIAPREFPPRLRAALIAAGAVAALLVIAFLLYPRAQVMNSAEIAAIQSRGVLRVGTLENAPGLSEDGVGLAADLARALAKTLFPDEDIAFVLEFVPVTEKTALPKLGAGELDVVLGRMVEDPDSATFVYSIPYYSDPVRFYCREESAGLLLSAQHVGVVQLTNEAALFTAFNEQNGTSLQTAPYGSYPDLVAALQEGRSDFIAMPETMARQMGASDLPRHAVALGELPYVAVVHSDTPALATLMTMLIDEYSQDGRLRELCREHGLILPTEETP